LHRDSKQGCANRQTILILNAPDGRPAILQDHSPIVDPNLGGRDLKAPV
jgi:hypothetical protein